MINMAETSKQQMKRKKGKKYFGGGKKQKKEDKLAVGMQGIMIFGVDRETEAKREAYNVLNEYADELFGSEFIDCVLHRDVDKKLIVDYQHGIEHAVIVENAEKSDSSEEEDIAKAIAKEVDQIKSVKKTRRFQGVSTGVHAIIFIKSTLSKDNLNELVHCILSDIEKTKQKKARSFQRLVPVTEICHADIESICKTVTETFLPEFNDDKNAPVKFCVHFKSRYNDTITRNDVLAQIAAIFLEEGHTVDLTTPDKVIIVEVMKGLCCMSVVKDFFRFKKYNIHTIVNTPQDKPIKSSGDKNKRSSTPEKENKRSSTPEKENKRSSTPEKEKYNIHTIANSSQDKPSESSGHEDNSNVCPEKEVES